MRHIILCLLAFCGLALAQAAEAGWRDRGSQGQPIKREQPRDGHTLTDLSYGDDPRQKLDVYLPDAPARAPIMVMVHGGAWFIGDKGHSGVTNNKVAYWVKQQGYILVSVNYRLVPDANPLEQAHDVARALAYTQTHAAEWGGDAKRIVLIGHSAGAHLVALLGANPAIATAEQAKRWNATIALDSAAMDIVSSMQQKHYFFYDKAFGQDEQLWLQTSPTLQLTRAATPMLIVCGEQRPDKPCDQARIFADRAAALGVPAQLLPLHKKHGAINADLGREAEYTQQVDAFIRRYNGLPNNSSR